jgi:hypothetical protein
MPASACLSCFDTELIGKIVKGNRGAPRLLAECEYDCESSRWTKNKKGSREGCPFVRVSDSF